MSQCWIGLENIPQIWKSSKKMEEHMILLSSDALFKTSPRTSSDKAFQRVREDPLTKELFVSASSKAWITSNSVEQDRENQIIYMRTVSKCPNSNIWWSSSSIWTSLPLICINQAKLTGWLQGLTVLLAEDKLKLTFSKGMPPRWNINFRGAGKSPQTT